MSNQKDGEVHCFLLQYPTAPDILNAEGLKIKYQNITGS